MTTHAWMTVSEINEWADRYNLDAIKRALKSVELSGSPHEISDVYIRHLPGGLDQFKKLVSQYGLSCKLDKTTGRYIVEKPGRAYK